MQTVHFGEVEVGAGDMIEFTGGIIPFVKAQRYVLLGRDDEAPFCWLQSADAPALAFVCVPVGALSAGHEAAIRRSPSLTPEERDDADILAFVVLNEEATGATANLLAPILVDRTRRRGRQVVREGDVGLCRVPVAAAAGEECHASAHPPGE